MNRTEYLLIVLAEECAEVAQVACKGLRFGLDDIGPGKKENNLRSLERELADLLAVVELLDLSIREEDKEAKFRKVAKYMEYSRKAGTLKDA